MATMLRFDEAKLETSESTYTVAEAKVANVEVEYTTGMATIYLEPINGVTFYMTLSKEEYAKVRQPTVDVPAELRDTEVERPDGQEVAPDKAYRAQLVDDDTRAFATEYGCGDETCTSCPIGLAQGLEFISKAYDAGYKQANDEANKSLGVEDEKDEE